MTTATTGNLAEQATDKDKEKIDKRRALGRGLASLLPGPRVVPQAPVAPVPAVGGHHAADPGGANPASSHSSAAVQAHAAELRSAGQPMAAVPTLAPDMPQAVVWPEEPAYDSQATVGTISINAVAESRIPGNLVVNLAIAEIDKNPFQTRYVQDDDALEELAESIKANGVVQPIMVRPSEDEEGRYVLILGERRLHASKKAGKSHIPALVRRVSRQQAAEMTIVENLQREDLSPLEQAESFRVLSNEFSLTQQEIGERVGLSRESVANYMRLLKLPREVMQMLAEKRITFAKAKELLKLGDNDRIAQAAVYAVQKGMNLEQIEMLVLRMDGLLDPLPDMPGVKKREKSTGGARWVDPNVRAAQLDLERTLGLRVRIRDRKGKGKIVIEYATVDDYDRVVEMLRRK
jgi:ParB family transcriptional regulator, chromosome partitioning protein